VVRFFTLKGLNPEIFTPNFHQCMTPTHLFCRQAINGTTVSLNGEWSYSIICDLDNFCKMILPRLLVRWFQNIILLCTRALYALQACKSYMLPYPTRHHAFKKFLFTLGSTLTRPHSLDCTRSAAIEKPNEWHFIRNCSKFWKMMNGTTLVIL
jgi:hypothetical protein